MVFYHHVSRTLQVVLKGKCHRAIGTKRGLNVLKYFDSLPPLPSTPNNLINYVLIHKYNFSYNAMNKKNDYELAYDTKTIFYFITVKY